ncbi:hypothetical protein HN51_055243 [Arachis hypogaea]|uniref:Early nodulin-like protein n=2 Tax=Arachis TaxID=3817 RepID=A0A444XNZ7_ARAHY|nr:mavicyanin [Arachis duranensis]XP_016174045.1 mavicyanin [Arachis ipaensis]XP_025619380.1 mavicyanin [Arachis hypogaea]XP_025679871.1 mavicyanin [Arachis hypogaea]QHN77913.1 Early nodulin-like protein [Arachis hypogaea]QHO34857.1 Early nodulin-like protein [Arachis hypogaea]RYQ91460.1 hypothetical protein Ahy_B09g097336 [Arachis hypogaea]RYR38709.1 hypothetical protein Ahy_A09g043869 [Arachis hypogaea]
MTANHHFSHNWLLLCLLLISFQIQTSVHCFQYKVGDLDSWGIPTSSNPQLYTKWSKNNDIKIGDSLLFLYPPSQDSLVQVTLENYKRCNIKNPILYMNNGNSLFNITSKGEYFFTSGEPGHCQKNQKIHITVGVNASSDVDAPSPYGSATSSAPSYQPVFGSIPQPPSQSMVASDSSHIASNSQALIIGFVMCLLFSALM